MAGRQVRELPVGASEAGQPLLDFLAARLRHLDRDRLQDLLKRGAIWTGKFRQHDPAYRTKAGETVLACFPPTGSYDEPRLTTDMVLFEGHGLLVVTKPSGWYSQSTPWDLHGNLVGAVERFLQERDGKIGFLHQVNRLDRETSGIVLFARDKALASPLQAAWSSRDVAKSYLAVVKGSWCEDVTIDAPIASAGRARFAVNPQGKPAQTIFRPLAQGDGWTFVEAEPLTGRTHQIRVHAAHHGNPLLGDSRYGGGREERMPYEFFLHAHRLALCLRGRDYAWSAPVPAAFQQFLSESTDALPSLERTTRT